MADLHALIENMDEEQRAGAIAILDAVSRPMSVREIEQWLRYRGKVSRSRAVKLASTLKHLHVIALVGPEATNGE